jgi:hypothetical protein
VLEGVKKSGRQGAATEDAAKYAGMVIRYVSNGSGTLDMIERALKQLRGLRSNEQ